jgi:hypothetical protein|tara:strand:+ start:246 stop:704 length:459 start_codon:yes stop_codon:yes gene_type:complete
MKIAKSQLKKVIKEEVEAVLNEGKMKALAAMIGHKATFWVGEVGLTDEDVAADPGAAWLDILTMVTAHWGKMANMAYGCARAPEDPNCQIIAAVQGELNNILDTASDNKRWISKNYKSVKNTFNFIPASKAPEALQNTPGWKTTKPDDPSEL